MAPTKTDTGHGSLFDLFPDRPQSLHGGARFDEGFGLQDKKSPKGSLFDEFGTPSASDSSHGQIWDEFGWREMPEIHGGLLYDDDYQDNSVNESSRGLLFDLFQPSTQVKFIYDGKDSEGIVDHVAGDNVVVTPRSGGDAVEVGLSQFLAYRSPSLDNASTTADQSSAEAPSARSASAHGGGRSAAPSPGSPVEPTPQGGSPDSKSAVAADWSIVDHLKSVLDGNDVAKTNGFSMHQVHPGYVQHTASPGGIIGHSRATGDGVMAHAKSGGSMNYVGTFPGHADAHKAIIAHFKEHAAMAKTRRLPSQTLKSYSEWGGVTTISKDMTTAQLAVQAEDGAAAFAGAKGAGSYCPECRESKAKLTEDGRCPDCNTPLKAHDGHTIVKREKGDGNGSAEDSSGKGVADKAYSIDDLRKDFGAAGDPGAGGQTVTIDPRGPSPKGTKTATGDPPDVEVPERSTPDSDHHGNLDGKPTMCPHCGQVIAELDAKTAEGAPSNVAPGGAAHKCVEGFLDTLKAAA